jgi:hypothetical protein
MTIALGPLAADRCAAPPPQDLVEAARRAVKRS